MKNPKLGLQRRWKQKLDRLQHQFYLLQRSPAICPQLVNSKDLEPHKSWKLT